MVNRRWVVNVAAVFGAIHFYTQWFERLGATPLSVLLGGLLMLGFALGLWAFNRERSWRRHEGHPRQAGTAPRRGAAAAARRASRRSTRAAS